MSLSNLQNTLRRQDCGEMNQVERRTIKTKISKNRDGSRPYPPTQVSASTETSSQSYKNKYSDKTTFQSTLTTDTNESVPSHDVLSLTILQYDYLTESQEGSKNELRIPSIDSTVGILSPPTTNRHPYRDYCNSVSVESDMDTSDACTSVSQHTVTDQTSLRRHTVMKMKAYFQKNYEKLKNGLYPDELADILFSKDIIRKSDREMINEMKYSVAKCDKLIKSVVKRSRKTNNEHLFVLKVLESFKEANYGYHVKDFNDFEEPTQFAELPVDDTWKGKVSYFLNVNGDEIDVLDIIDKLLVSNALTFEEHQSILDVPCKGDKLKELEESITKKSRKVFDDFCSVMKCEYPTESKLLFDDDIYSVMDTAEDRNSPIFEMQELKEVDDFREDDIVETTGIKLYIGGANGGAREVEQMIVDQNSPKPSERLVEMVSEDIHCGIEKVVLSCIKITFEHMSEQSRMLLLQKCKASPKFLERWMKCLIDQDKVDYLKQKGIHEVQVNVQINWPEFVLSRQDIARNYSFLTSQLEPREYNKLLQENTGTCDVIKMINSEKEKKTRCNYFIMYMVTDEHAPIEKFSAELKGTEIMEHIKENVKCYKTCGCKLTKKKIVKNYTLLEKEVEVDRMIDIFIEFYRNEIKIQNDRSKGNGDASTRDGMYEKLNSIKNCEPKSSKIEEFLMMILNSEDNDINVCLFGEALIDTNQEQLLRKMLIKSYDSAEFSLSKDDVRRNESFLHQELEPLLFIEVLPPENSNLREQIVDTNSRERRCDLFINFLKESDSAVFEKFFSELKRRNMQTITEHLQRSKHHVNFVTKDDISQNRVFLEDMLTPKLMGDILTAAENDKSKTDLYDVLSSFEIKEARDILDTLMCSEGNAFKEFIAYLEEYRPEIVTFLVRSRPEDSEMISVKDSVLEAYSCIISEIEPKRLKQMFVERGVISRDEYNSICSKSTRRGRAIELMSKVIAGPHSRSQFMIEALEFYGYRSLVKQIIEKEEKIKRCPRIYRLREGVKQYGTFEGSVKIKFDDDTIVDFLSSLEDYDNAELVEEWLHKSQDNNFDLLASLGDYDNVEFVTERLHTNQGEPSLSDNLEFDVIDGFNNATDEVTNTKCRKDQCANILHKPIHCKKMAHNKSSISSLLGYDRVDEIKDERSVSSTIMSTEEDSKSSFDSERYLKKVRHDLTSISNDFEKQQDTVSLKRKFVSPARVLEENTTKNHIIKQSTATTEQNAYDQVKCCCIICGENAAHTDFKMGECKLHSLYYIK